jgi:hypothetical protein
MKRSLNYHPPISTPFQCIILGVRRYLVLGEAAANGAGLLGAEVEGEVLLVLVRISQRRLLLLRHHREHARDGGAHHLAAKPTRCQFVSIKISFREQRRACKQT